MWGLNYLNVEWKSIIFPLKCKCALSSCRGILPREMGCRVRRAAVRQEWGQRVGVGVVLSWCVFWEEIKSESRSYPRGAPTIWEFTGDREGEKCVLLQGISSSREARRCWPTQRTGQEVSLVITIIQRNKLEPWPRSFSSPDKVVWRWNIVRFWGMPSQITTNFKT